MDGRGYKANKASKAEKTGDVSEKDKKQLEEILKLLDEGEPIPEMTGLKENKYFAEMYALYGKNLGFKTRSLYREIIKTMLWQKRFVGIMRLERIWNICKRNLWSKEKPRQRTLEDIY